MKDLSIFSEMVRCLMLVDAVKARDYDLMQSLVDSFDGNRNWLDLMSDGLQKQMESIGITPYRGHGKLGGIPVDIAIESGDAKLLSWLTRNGIYVKNPERLLFAMVVAGEDVAIEAFHSVCGLVKASGAKKPMVLGEPFNGSQVEVRFESGFYERFYTHESCTPVGYAVKAGFMELAALMLDKQQMTTVYDLFAIERHAPRFFEQAHAKIDWRYGVESSMLLDLLKFRLAGVDCTRLAALVVESHAKTPSFTDPKSRWRFDLDQMLSSSFSELDTSEVLKIKGELMVMAINEMMPGKVSEAEREGLLLEALRSACKSGSLELMQVAVSHGASSNGLLHESLPAHVYKHLIDLGEDLEGRDKDGNTPLALACLKGREEDAKALVALGADIRAKMGARSILQSVSMNMRELLKSASAQYEVSKSFDAQEPVAPRTSSSRAKLSF